MLSSDGKVSSKRLVTLFAFLMMAIGFIVNLFWDQDISVDIYDSMKWIVGLGLGFTASEQFKPRNKDEDSNEK
jgi:hypothetical protein